MSAITITGLSKSYGGISALEDFNLSIDDNELMVIYGGPSSGKTTLLRILSGLESSDSGTVSIDGQTVIDAQSKLSIVDSADHTVSMVFQSGALWPHMTIYDHVAFCVDKKRRKQELKNYVYSFLEKLKISHLADKKPKELSCLDYQRAALARALVGGTRNILIDSISKPLSFEQRIELRNDLKRLHRELALTIILTTGDQQEAFSFATRVAVIDKGKAIQTGAPAAVYQNPLNLTVARMIGDPVINLIPAKAQVDSGVMTVQSVLGIQQFTSDTFTDRTIEEELFDCVIGVRAEHIHIHGQEAENTFPALVCSSQISTYETIVQLETEAQQLTAKCLGVHSFEDGTPLHIHICPEEMNVFHLPSESLIKMATFPLSR